MFAMLTFSDRFVQTFNRPADYAGISPAQPTCWAQRAKA
jgi:hypothetical protein